MPMTFYVGLVGCLVVVGIDCLMKYIRYRIEKAVNQPFKDLGGEPTRALQLIHFMYVSDYIRPEYREWLFNIIQREQAKE